MKKIIFVVDDNSTNLTVAEDALADHYQVIALPSAAVMFKALEKFCPDLILLDIDMPEITGFEAMEKLKADERYSNIPVIFLTGLNDSASEAHGIKLGAVDFIMKPFSEPVLLNRLKNHLFIDDLIRKRTAQLEERTEQLELLKNGLVCTMADLVENRDKNTGGHIDRTAGYMKILIDAMIEQGVYKDEILEWDLDLVLSSARLHDLGKIAIPDSILNKPDKLTDEEFSVMKTHSLEGERIISNAMKRTGEVQFLQYAKIIAASHHERWNGAGYPYALSGEAIPLQGRIMAVIDVYDALVSERPYKKAFSHEKAIQIIMEDAGSHFDPRIAEVFNSISEQIEKLKDEI